MSPCSVGVVRRAWIPNAGLDQPTNLQQSNFRPELELSSLGWEVGVTAAWHGGVDDLGGTVLGVTRNAVAGLGLPLGPLAIEVPLWVADGISEDQRPWSLWMFKLDLMSLNPLELVRQSLQ